MHQNFEVIEGLNYRLPAAQVKAGVVKKFASHFHSYTFLFLGIIIIRPMLISKFFNQILISSEYS